MNQDIMNQAVKAEQVQIFKAAGIRKTPTPMNT